MGKQSDSEVPGKRLLQDLDQPLKGGFRKGITKRDILRTMDDDDWKRIEEYKHYQQFNKDSITARVALQNDSVRADRDTKIDNIDEMLNHIRNALTTNERKQEQLDTDNITDELREGIKMNKHELEFEIHAANRIIRNTIKRIMNELGRLRNIVGSHDFLGRDIMTEKQYDALVLRVEKDLIKFGLDLFDKEVQDVGGK